MELWFIDPQFHLPDIESISTLTKEFAAVACPRNSLFSVKIAPALLICALVALPVSVEFRLSAKSIAKVLPRELQRNRDMVAFRTIKTSEQHETGGEAAESS
jgi:hypothetical protein